MSNSPFVFSVQPVSITIANNATSGTYTLPTSVSSNAFILWNGSNPTDTTGTWKYTECALSISGNTVTAQRTTSSSTTSATVFGTVIDPTSLLVTSVQYGSVTLNGASSGTYTLPTSVNTSLSAVFWLGETSANNSAGSILTNVTQCTLTNSTTVTVTSHSTPSNNITCYFCVVQFASSAIKSIQSFITTASTANTTTDSQTITSVVPANTIISYGGTSTASTSPASAYFIASLSSATSVTFTNNTASTSSRTHYATVIEFVDQVISVQNGSLSTGSALTNTAAITSVDTTISAINYTGFNTAQTANDAATTYSGLVLTNGTTVTGSVAATGGSNNAGYTVFTFGGGAIVETGSASDTASVAFIASQTLAETSSASDATSLHLIAASAVGETGSASDSASVAYSAASAATETGSASDLASASYATSAGITEAGSATDTASGTKVTSGAVVEIGSASDTATSAFIAATSLMETGSASDTTSGQRITYASIVETGSASDTVSIPASNVIALSEFGSAFDVASATVITNTSTVVPIGSANDILGRILVNLPYGWFPQSSTITPPKVASPILAGFLAGPVAAYSWIYDLLSYVASQMYVQTASGFNLDLIALDYFGDTLSRRPGESDPAFATRMQASFFLPKGTRAAVSQAVKVLTGTAPTIFEPWNPSDTGGYGSSAHPHIFYGAAYNQAGGYGSRNLPYQMFVQTTGANASVNPVAGVNGWGGHLSGWGVGAGEWVNGDLNTGSLSDQEIYDAIAGAMPAGTIAWTSIAP